MPIFLLDETLSFPDPSDADDETGILAVGGDLSPARLILAYSMGIFPWYDELVTPILWHSPRQRFVMRPEDLAYGRSIRRAVKRSSLAVRYDTAFEAVIAECATVPRHGQNGTWLNRTMQQAYIELFRQGYAHSAEAWLGDRLVGGAYGVTLGGVFFGESMFSSVPDASKVVYAHLVPALHRLGYRLIDCQVYTEHLSRFGATDWPRDRFQAALKDALMVRPRPLWPLNGD
ncbi:MAG: leucyl/phenylalanyl-tRNA--protein transferase [Myxococcota bacterium]|nr:leucyl/phenylalanyl-tRNA--protein transferase [Myxococcota bacterium]